MTTRLAGRIVQVVAAALLIASCSAGPSANDGPLGNGGSAGGICIPIRAGQVESWGVTEFVNNGQSDAVIEKITLVKARRVHLTASYIVPITGSLEYGSWFGYPPAPPQKGVEWSQHSAVKGARIAPRIGSRHSNLLAVLRPNGSVAQLQAIRVAYREANKQFLFQTHYRILLLVGRNNCPADWQQKFPG